MKRSYVFYRTTVSCSNHNCNTFIEMRNYRSIHFTNLDFYKLVNLFLTLFSFNGKNKKHF